MITQLNPPIPLDTPKGAGYAILVIDYGTEHDLFWVVFIDRSRECWTFSNRDIRAQTNVTMGRGAHDETAEVPFAKESSSGLNRRPIVPSVG